MVPSNWIVCLLAVSALAVLLPAQAFTNPRPSMSLDGEWSFRFAPDDRGTSEKWFGAGVRFERKSQVPGCWDASGRGPGTDKMRHNEVGVGWYRRRIGVPDDWRQGHVWLAVGGVHRSARVWVNGKLVAEHVGYPVAFRADITDALKPKGEQDVVIAVDSRRDTQRDPLVGTFDVIDYMDLTWGGIYEHVWLEATGGSWIDSAFVIPKPTSHAATAIVTVSPHKDRLILAYDVANVHGQQYLTPDETDAKIALDLTGAELWSPDHPSLITMSLTLRNAGDALDRYDVRFGLRLLEARGTDFFLNGERFFLRGYGDDFTFPRELLPPADVAYWKQYLQRRKEFGFNAVRHHSMMPTESYLTAADEVGMLVQPELPIAYSPNFAEATREGRELYAQVWADYIRQMRNHPCILGWCMGNEEWNGFDLGHDLYLVAKQLDPSRLVIDTDGVWPGASRPTLDYAPVQFNEGTLPWGATRNKYDVKEPAAPVVVHEMANISVLPDPADVPRYAGLIKPFWLEQMRDAVARQGLKSRLPEMLRASRRLQASLLKLNMEAARLVPGIDGYYQWLFRDYWTQSSGFVSQFDETRALTPETALRFNGPAALLWDRDRVSFRPGETVPIRIFLSDFRRVDQPALKEVQVTLGTAHTKLTTPADAGKRGLIGPWTGSLTIPKLRSAEQLTLTAAAGGLRNEWPVWVFPAPLAGKSQSSLVVTHGLSADILDKLEHGAAVLLTDPAAAFPTVTARFKPAWWKGDENDNCFGNMLSDHAALRGFPAEGYGDLEAFSLLDNRPVVLLEQVPGKLEPIVWCLDLPWRMWRKAYLFEARVGKGRLLVSTMDLSTETRAKDPAADWLYARLIRYVSSSAFHPSGFIPVAWLRERLAQKQ